MTLKQRSHIEAAVGTVIAMLLLFLLLWLVYLSTAVPEEEEGIEVAFGVTDEGGGYEPEQSPVAPTVTVAPPPTPAAPSNNDLMTQDDEESLALQRQREEDKRRKQELAEAERQRREEQAREQARLEAERLAKEQALAEQRAKEQAARDKANAFGSLFGNNSSGANGSGDSQGGGQKGNPLGKGSSGGTSWSLAGRSNKALPKPVQDFQEAGVVVVEIVVDANGDVISAKSGAAGTNTASATLHRLAEQAAKKAKFSTSDNPQQRGTITYNFVLN